MNTSTDTESQKCGGSRTDSHSSRKGRDGTVHAPKSFMGSRAVSLFFMTNGKVYKHAKNKSKSPSTIDTLLSLQSRNQPRFFDFCESDDKSAKKNLRSTCPKMFLTKRHTLEHICIRAFFETTSWDFSLCGQLTAKFFVTHF